MKAQAITRIFLCFLLSGSLVFETKAQGVSSARYPDRPLSLIVAFSPGGTVDLAFRLLAREMEKHLGQVIVVQNRVGAGGAIAMNNIALAKPDGYTIGQVPTQTLFVMPFIGKLQQNPLTDITYISQFAESAFGIVVKNGSSSSSMKDLISEARRRTDPMDYGTNAATGIANLVVEQIARQENLRFSNIPFKGSPEAHAALLGGHIDFVVGEINTALLEKGPTRLLALFSEKARLMYPAVPTIKELGYDIPAPLFYVLAGPKGMPTALVNRIDEVVAKVVREPVFLKGAQDLKIAIAYRDHKELNEYIVGTYEYFGKLLTTPSQTK